MAKCADYSASSCSACSSNALSISNPIFTKGIPSPESSNTKIDWDAIIPKIEPYSLNTRQDNSNYDKASRQLFRQNTANIKDILESNQKTVMSGYQNSNQINPIQNNFYQNNDRIAA